MSDLWRAGWRDVSFRIGHQIFSKHVRNSSLLGNIRRRASFWARESFVISYPKSGRTWLRTMIGYVIDKQYDLNLRNPMEVQHLWKLSSKIPIIGFNHDDEPHLKHADQISSDKRKYKRKRVLFLARDPRDVIVSYYFDAKNRMKVIDCSIEEFLYNGPGSIDSVIRFYNAWAQARTKVLAFHLVNYEDLSRTPEPILRVALEFLGIVGASDALIQEAVQFASFDNLKKIEKADAFNHERMRPANPANPDSFKVRRGKVGGFVDYFSDKEIDYINERILSSLDPFFSRYIGTQR